MKFFTAADVLNQATNPDPGNPVTIHIDSTIQQALKIMFENNYSQLPVELNGDIVGAITSESIARVLKIVDNVDVTEQRVKAAIEDAVFVSGDKDIYVIFETLATDQFVLIGSESDLQGIITRYDVFHFLKRQVEPFLMIGEIEENLRDIFAQSFDDEGNLQIHIDWTFADRTRYDDYTPPSKLEEFSFNDYHTFISKNTAHLPERISEDQEYILWIIDEVRKNRNDLFHFRETVDDIDRDLLEVAHNHITGLAE